MNNQGLLLCARYSAAPNYFGYCGPDENKSLVDHLKENIADSEVTHILKEFETLYPYLQLIARENKIDDPFDEKVVEAYWLGNNLLQNVKNSAYLSFISEKLFIEKKLFKKKLTSLKFPPHHAFHVFNIFRRTGHDFSIHTVKTMDDCRIGLGRIISSPSSQKSKIKNQNYNPKLKNKEKIFVQYKPLIMIQRKLLMGNDSIKELKIDYKGKSFVKDLKLGDWVSFHWGMICGKLTQVQVRNLEFYTQKAIDFYNSCSVIPAKAGIYLIDSASSAE